MHRSAVASSLLAVAVGLLAGCPDRSISELNPLQGRVEAKDIPVNVNRDLDLLFLIDDSPSMADKQKNLADNFKRFIEVLSSIPGGLPNVHIGVATSDMGTQSADGLPPGPQIGTIGMGGCSGSGKDGVLQLFTAQGSVGGDLFISDIADTSGNRTRNYTGDLSDVFGKMAKAGASGCGFEQHLEAIKRSLSNPANQRFLRPDAFLGVIIIADEDDCSLLHSSLLGPPSNALGDPQSFRCTRFGVTCDQGGQNTDAMNQVGTKNQCHPNDSSAYLTKVTDYVKFLKSLKPNDPNKVVVAGIMGTVDPFAVELRAPQDSTTKIPALAHSCTYIGGDNDGDGKPDPEFGDPPIRLKFFLDQFPNRSTFASICQQNLAGGLQQIGDLLKTVIGDPCIEGKLADVDPDTAGPQYDCAVSVITNPGKPNAQETILPRCPAPTAGAACWRLDTDATSCPKSEHFVLKIDGQDTLPKDAHILANCVTEVTN
ncbi:MAG TPA: hypothetical protein VGD37_35220 [Kofleriaceae bacterium]|jgi:hypothetical protein